MFERPDRGSQTEVSRTAPRSGLDEAATDRVAGELDPIAHAELVEDVRAVVLDGPFADREHRRDGRPLGSSLGDQLEDLELAGG